MIAQRSFLAVFLVVMALTGSAAAQPTITSLSFTPTTVNTSTASASVTVNFSLTGTGVYYFATAFQDPNGISFAYQKDKTFAAANSVTDSVIITLPAAVSPPGTWKLAYAFALDANGFAYLATPDAVTAAFPSIGTLTVTATVDTTPPNITALTFNNSINTTSSSVNLSVGYTVTDAGGSGAASLYVGFLSPSGGTTRGTLATFTPGASVSGTLMIPFPQLTESGTWTISNVIVSDQANNTLVLNTLDVANKGFATTLNVTSAVDTTPPTLTSLSFTPASITTNGSPVNVAYTVTDDLSGANSVSILFVSPSGTQQQSGSASFTAATSASGTIGVTFPSGTELGTWTVGFVLVSDAAGNTRLYKTTCSAGDPPSCTSLGSFPSTLPVNPPGADTTPPLISSTISPMPNGAGWNNSVPVTVTWTVVDGESAITSTTNCGPTTISAPTLGTTVTCTATSAGGTSSASVLIKIDTAAPVTTNTVATPNPVIINTDVTITATVTDTGGSHVASAEFQVDGGPFDDLAGAFGTDSVNVSLTLPASATPLLQSTGVHNICVRGTDFADNIGATQCVLFAVYDPSGGFATGGGGTNSPAGADSANPSGSGPVTFAFNPKYLPNNNTVPSGNLEFHYDAGNIVFKATSWDFLVVTNGNRGQAQGTGTLNQTSTCKFSLDAWDNSFQPNNVDAFGLTIFNCDGGTTARYSLPATPTTKGSIVVHQ